MKLLFRQGNRLCVAKQSLIEAWVVATCPRDVNGFGYDVQFAIEGTRQTEAAFYLLADTDDIYGEWVRLVSANRVLGKEAYDARPVAMMKVLRITRPNFFPMTDSARAFVTDTRARRRINLVR